MQAALIDLLLAAEEPAPEPEELGLVAAPRSSSPRGELAAAELLVAAYLPAAAAAGAI